MIENKSILNKFVNLNNTKVIPTKNKKLLVHVFIFLVIYHIMNEAFIIFKV